jgi:hypothetical protein
MLHYLTVFVVFLFTLIFINITSVLSVQLFMIIESRQHAPSSYTKTMFVCEIGLNIVSIITCLIVIVLLGMIIYSNIIL